MSQHVRDSWYVPGDAGPRCPFCGEPPGPISEPICVHYVARRDPSRYRIAGSYTLTRRLWNVCEKEGIVRHASIEGGSADEYIFEKMPVFQLRGKAFEAGFGTSMAICFVDPDLKDRMLSQARELLKRIDEHYA